jgi:hypothetical protein
VISYDFWRTRMAQSPDVLNKTVQIDNRAMTIILAPQDFPRLGEVGVDPRVFLFTLAVSVVTAVLFGLASAMQTSRIDLNETLKRGISRSGVGGSGRLSRVS